jgi:hypothetical protein
MTGKSAKFPLDPVNMGHNVPFDAALWMVMHLLLMGAFEFRVSRLICSLCAEFPHMLIDLERASRVQAGRTQDQRRNAQLSSVRDRTSVFRL